jgi:uncharacterized protein (DUF2235 family)
VHAANAAQYPLVEEHGMHRQLIICCDGTDNNLTGRRNDTNVAQLCELLAPDSQNQLLYYDPGVGNAGELPEANPWDRIQQKFKRASSLAYGSGIYENIADAYRFLMRHWQPDDQIFLYGFSRGAFTARSVGGLVTQFGLLRPEMDAMVPTLLYLYFLDRKKFEKSYGDIKAQISELFVSDAARTAPVWFVGVWDTVASVGAPLVSREITATPTIVKKRFSHVRQALALDEHRRSFQPRLYSIEANYNYAEHGQSIDQQWFSGAHCDVGGGYLNAQAGLSRQALLWMVRESSQCQLRLRPDLLTDQGQADTEKIANALALRAKLNTMHYPMVHSASYASPWWALGGLHVRNTRQADVRVNYKEKPPQESSTVQANQLRFPASTQWRSARALTPVVLAALLAFVFWVIAGTFLLGPTQLAGQNWWQQILAGVQALPAVASANTQFASWQTAWFMPWQEPTASLATWHNPAMAVVTDFGLILAYGYLLGWAVSWAFARLAQLRRVDDALPVWLNRLGLAAPVAIVCDLSENVLTLALLATAPSPYVPGWEYLLGFAMSLASIGKWLGLAACAVLIAWGCVRKSKQMLPQTVPTST